MKFSSIMVKIKREREKAREEEQVLRFEEQVTDEEAAFRQHRHR